MSVKELARRVALQAGLTLREAEKLLAGLSKEELEAVRRGRKALTFDPIAIRAAGRRTRSSGKPARSSGAGSKAIRSKASKAGRKRQTLDDPFLDTLLELSRFY